MNFKRSTLAAAVAGVLALGAAGNAAASVYAGSKLDLEALTVVVSSSAVANPITGFQFTTTNTATLNGVTDVKSATCGGVFGGDNCNAASPRLDAAAANALGGAPARANNDFSFFGPSLNQYSNSDSVILTAELTGDATSATSQIAEAELQFGTSASANAEIQSQTGFSFVFIVSGGGGLAVSFDADPAMRAVISQPSPPFVNGSAQANMAWTLTLTYIPTSETVTWSPQGTSGDDCDVDAGLAGLGVTCTETADGADLNRNLSTSANPSDVQHSLAAGLSSFGVSIAGLFDGEWSFALSETTSVQLRQTIPEPATLALLGAGLVGIGAARRRKVRA